MYSHHHQRQLRVFREMHSVRDFCLVLGADISKFPVKRAAQTLERLVKADMKEGSDYLLYRPLAILRNGSSVLVLRPTVTRAGQGARWYVFVT